MTNTQIINNLWQEMRDAINKTYANNKEPKIPPCKVCGHEWLPGHVCSDPVATYDDITCLRDYAEDISMSDDLAELLGRETANERQHRKYRPSPIGFSAGTAAKLILMNNVVKGAQMAELPRATSFLVLRRTAVEAEVIGWIIKSNLDPNWIKAVESFDYSKLMQETA